MLEKCDRNPGQMLEKCDRKCRYFLGNKCLRNRKDVLRNRNKMLEMLEIRCEKKQKMQIFPWK